MVVPPIIVNINVGGNAIAGLNNVAKSVDKVHQSVNKSTKGIRTFDMRLLGMMFSGMAMQRAFGGMLRGVMNTFLKAEDHTSGLAQATTRLNASWEFLKFSIMDALNTESFIGMIDGIVNVINWFSELSSGWKVTFLAITGGLFILGTGFMLLGQSKLGWDAMFGMDGFFTSTGKISAKTLGENGVFTKLKKFALAGIAIKAIFDITKYLEEEISLRELIDSLGTDLALVGLVSGIPWVIAIGVAMKLIPMADKFKKIGRNMMDSSSERIKDTILNPNPTSGFRSFAGVAEFLAGSIIAGVGVNFGWINDYVEGIDKSADVTTNKLVPTVTKATDALIGTEEGKGGLANGYKSVGKEMDNVTTEKIPAIVAANKTVTESTDEMTASEERYQDRLAKRAEIKWNRWKEDVDASSVTSDE